MIRTVKQFIAQNENKTLVLINKAFPRYAVLILVVPDPAVQVMYKKTIVVSDIPVSEKLNKDILTTLTQLNDVPVDLLKTIVQFDTRFSLWKNGEATWNSLLLTESHKSFIVEKKDG